MVLFVLYRNLELSLNLFELGLEFLIDFLDLHKLCLEGIAGPLKCRNISLRLLKHPSGFSGFQTGLFKVDCECIYLVLVLALSLSEYLLLVMHLGLKC
jgi:hypothetical protein